MTRRNPEHPTRRQILAILPARAVTVYVLIVVVAVAVLLGSLAYVDLIQRTRAVCGPLRFGQHAGEQQAKSQLGQDFARTFQGAADELGCAAHADR